MSDAEAFDTQIAYLRERSAFYRAKGIERVGLDQIATLPLTDKAHRVAVKLERGQRFFLDFVRLKCVGG